MSNEPTVKAALPAAAASRPGAGSPSGWRRGMFGLKVSAMSRSSWKVVTDPLRGRTPLSRVVWVYGVVGSLAYGALELLLDPGSPLQMRLYAAGGLVFSVYVTVSTYQCAGNCASAFWARMARLSAVLSLLLLPLLFYLDWSGALSLALLGEQ